MEDRGGKMEGEGLAVPGFGKAVAVGERGIDGIVYPLSSTLELGMSWGDWRWAAGGRGRYDRVVAVIIREATAADTEVLTPMFRSALAHHAELAPARYALGPEFRLYFRRWLGRLLEDSRSVVLVAEDVPEEAGNGRRRAGGKETGGQEAGAGGAAGVKSPIMGFLLASVQTEPPIFAPHEYAMVHQLWVEPGHRRTGAASKLLAAAAGFFAKLGMTQLRLETYAHNAAARAFLERNGFHASTVTMTRPLSQQGGERQGGEAVRKRGRGR